MPRLSDHKYEAFAQHYAANRNAAAAAKAAGSESATPDRIGYELLERPEIRARVAEITKRALDAADVTGQRVMIELARVAFGDVRKVFNGAGELLPVHEIDDDTAACISGIEFEDITRGAGRNAVVVRVGKIKRYDKNPALNTLAKHFKLVGDEGDGVNALASALADRLNTARKRIEPEPTPRPVVDTSVGDEDLT